jgi:hypothetical protein
LLDPRVKTAPFLGNICKSLTIMIVHCFTIFLAQSSADTLLTGKIPSLEEAVGLLKAEEKLKIVSIEDSHTAPSDIEAEKIIMEPQPKKARPMFAIVQQSQSTSAMSRSMSEVDKYLKLDVMDPNSCPLTFWKKQTKAFPILTEIAQAYLGRPASSGGVERLFSVAGSIARARRARLTIENMEKVLMLQQFYSNSC